MVVITGSKNPVIQIDKIRITKSLNKNILLPELRCIVCEFINAVLCNFQILYSFKNKYFLRGKQIEFVIKNK